MSRPRSAILGLALVGACHGEAVENPATSGAAPPVDVAPAVATGAKVPVAGATTRVQVRVLSCLPVGYGIACSCEVDAPGGGGVARARLEACVGSGDTLGLSGWLEERFQRALPLSVWMDVVPAPESARYCGVLLFEAGGHWRVVDFAGARPR